MLSYCAQCGFIDSNLPQPTHAALQRASHHFRKKKLLCKHYRREKTQKFFYHVRKGRPASGQRVPQYKNYQSGRGYEYSLRRPEKPFTALRFCISLGTMLLQKIPQCGVSAALNPFGAGRTTTTTALQQYRTALSAFVKYCLACGGSGRTEHPIFAKERLWGISKGGRAYLKVFPAFPSAAGYHILSSCRQPHCERIIRHTARTNAQPCGREAGRSKVISFYF
jgi:hypothetical protein